MKTGDFFDIRAIYLHSSSSSPQGPILCPTHKNPTPRLAHTTIMTDPKLPINVDPRVSPDSPADQQPTIGLIGMGAMGKMYADRLDDAGWKKCVFFSSLSSAFPQLGG